jgi:hypothetical protein
MSKVYLVTKGYYSDYCVMGAYTTREKAQHVLPLFSDTWNRAEIEEIELDLYLDLPAGYGYWTLQVLPDGSLREGYSYKRDPSEDLKPNVFVKAWPHEEIALIVVLARDLKHAVKIMSDLRAQAIYEGTWPL